MKKLVGKIKGSPMKVSGTGKTPQGKGITMPKKGKIAKPKGLTGLETQTEGYTPRPSLPTAKRAGGAKARERRLEKLAM